MLRQRESKDLSMLLNEKLGLLRKQCNRLWMQCGENRLSESEWHLLSGIGESLVSAAEISRMMGITRQAVHKITRSLLEKGLLTLIELPSNRREKFVRVSELGVRSVEEYSHIALQVERQVAQTIGEENVQLLKGLLEQEWLSPAPALSYTAE